MSLLRKNIFSLFFLQGANYILPLIAVPYLVRVLGAENFGRIAFAQAFIQYFVVLTNYGFNLSATRSVSLIRNDRVELSRFFSAVMIIKFGLMVIGFLLMLSITYFVPRMKSDLLLYEIVYLMVVGNALFPQWLFQGLEKMRHITVLVIVARTLLVGAIFAFVHDQSDYYLAAGLQAGGLVVAGLLALMVVPRIIQVRPQWPGLSQLRAVAVDGWHVFLSTAAISLYTSSNVFFLGLITNPTTVGYFAAAEKLIQAVQGLVNPVSQAVFPHVAAIMGKSRGAALAFLGKLLWLQGLGTLLLSVGLFIMAQPLVTILLGHGFESSIALVRWMALLPFLIGLSNVLGIQTMLNFDMKKIFSRILLVSGVVNIIFIIPLAYWLGAEGAAISVVLTEAVVTSLMAWVLAKEGIMQSLTHKRKALS